MNTRTIIIKPVVTEKSMNDVSGGKYTFAVAKDATKTDVKREIANIFKVKVVSVVTSIVKGKTKRVGPRREEVKGSAWKKATITLAKGEKISLFEPGTE